MRREEMDCGPDVSRDEEIAEEVRLHELEESRRLAAALPVLAVMHALEAGRSTTPGVSLAALKREVNASFGRTVAR